MKKMRLLALGLVAQLCFSHAYALGVRAIEVKSGLDQKLHAEIMLTDVSDKPLFFAVRATSEGQNIKDIGYVLQKNKSGEDVLKITSQRPINKAVLNLDVLGREGKQQVLADSYTIMLDPVAKPAEASFEHYGPVKKGQSLDSVAAEVKPVYVQLNIAKQAIKMANPHAFENGNSQKLIEGSFLIIPDLAFHISENQVTNETKIAELNIQFQALAKELSAGLEGVSTKHGSLAQKVLDIEAKMSAILESIAAVERGQKAIYAKLREHDQALAARKEEPLGGEFTWLSAGILIVILAIIWLAYRLVRRYRANQVEDGPDGSSGKAKKSLKDLIKKDKVSLNNQQDKAVETPSESAEENIEEEKPSSNDQPKKGYDARTISDDDLLISEKMKSDDGLFLNTSFDDEPELSDEETERLDVEKTNENQQQDEEIDKPIPVHTLEVEDVVDDETEIASHDDQDVSPVEEEVEVVQEDKVVEDEAPVEEDEIKNTEEECDQEEKPALKLKLRPLDDEGNDEDEKK